MKTLNQKLRKINLGDWVNNSEAWTTLKFRSAFSIPLLVISLHALSQDPVLPPNNLGTANIFDGMAGKPGFIYQGFAQAFQTQKRYDQKGDAMESALKINSILQMNQLIYLSKVKVLGGNLAFTVLIPLVQLSADEEGGQAPPVNPGIMGDLIQGTAIQWSDKRLFGKSFSHRAEFDITFPTGNYSARYAVNPSSHNWSYSVYHAFTILVSENLSVSARNQFNYNARFMGTVDKAGAYYNGNYSFAYGLSKALKLQAVAYYLAQMTEDSHNGDERYFQQEYGLESTKENVVGIGPGVAYFTNSGVLIEAKAFFETSGKNRLTGTRPTLRITIPLGRN